MENLAKGKKKPLSKMFQTGQDALKPFKVLNSDIFFIVSNAITN